MTGITQTITRTAHSVRGARVIIECIESSRGGKMFRASLAGEHREAIGWSTVAGECKTQAADAIRMSEGI